MYHSHWACPPTRLLGDYGTILFRRDLPLITTMTFSILQWNVRGFKSHRPYLLPLLDSLHPRITRLRLGTSLLRHGHLFHGQVASGGVIVRTPKCGVSVCIPIYRKTVRDRQILIVAS